MTQRHDVCKEGSSISVAEDSFLIEPACFRSGAATLRFVDTRPQLVCIVLARSLVTGKPPRSRRLSVTCPPTHKSPRTVDHWRQRQFSGSFGASWKWGE